MKTIADQQFVKIVIAFVGLTGLVFTLNRYFVPVVYEQYSFSIMIILEMLIIWYGREKIFGVLIFKVPAISTNNPLGVGTWSVYIEFDDGGVIKKRQGTIELRPSLRGLSIVGGALMDTDANRVTMREWYSENAEILNYDGHEIIYYIYKVPGRSVGQKSEKIGFVYAIRCDVKEPFVGYFRDIRVVSGVEQLREGRAKLHPTAV